MNKKERQITLTAPDTMCPYCKKQCTVVLIDKKKIDKTVDTIKVEENHW